MAVIHLSVPPCKGGKELITNKHICLMGTKNSLFHQTVNEKHLVSFFRNTFPDSIPLMPELVKEYFANPTGHLIIPLNVILGIQIKRLLWVMLLMQLFRFMVKE
mmetsp:Transcript_65726/g.99096  ORF Transcript_65726/g.99096 Transcript_65726/m.99096 type:complete len:104 (-) Transcript_65726:2-313(-)